MTDNALSPIDTTPLAFEAHLTGPVYSKKDRGVKIAISSVYEVPDEYHSRLCEMQRGGTQFFSVIVPDAKSAEDVTLPQKPETKQIQGTKKPKTPSEKLRWAIICHGMEKFGISEDEAKATYYPAEMAKIEKPYWDELDDMRREKAFGGVN